MAVALCPIATASAQPAPSPAPATIMGSIDDGPGSFSVYRTVDSGQRPTAADNAACGDYFGSPRSLTVVERLDARMYTFANDPSTGFLSDPTAQNVGPIYVCDGPTIDGQAFLDQWGVLTAPGLGRLSMNGPCGLEFMIGSPGRAAVDCVLRVNPNDSGVTDGVATSNSVANPLRLPDGRTGSLWTLYTLGEGTAPVAEPVAGTPQPTGSVKYSVGREVNSVSAGSTAVCPGGLRTTEIHSISVDPATGAASTEPSQDIAATASICYQNPSSPDFGASLSITSFGVTPALTATSTGQCRRTDLAVEPGTVQQSCGFTLPPQPGRGLTGGQVTLNGLVPTNDAAGSANSAIWTTSFLGSITPR
ncbi:Excinuclease ATPase subunit [Rhodococcus sp. AW25M09]|nr:Excinuclease ATPase subunit [Rhodococcus sp. AW25M09]